MSSASRSISIASGNADLRKVDFPVPLGANKKNDVTGKFWLISLDNKAPANATIGLKMAIARAEIIGGS